MDLTVGGLGREATCSGASGAGPEPRRPSRRTLVGLNRSTSARHLWLWTARSPNNLCPTAAAEGPLSARSDLTPTQHGYGPRMPPRWPSPGLSRDPRRAETISSQLCIPSTQHQGRVNGTQSVLRLSNKRVIRISFIYPGNTDRYKPHARGSVRTSRRNRGLEEQVGTCSDGGQGRASP